MDSGKKKFQEIVKKEMGIDFDVTIEINRKRFLTLREPHDHGRDTVQGFDSIEDESLQKNEEDKKWLKIIKNLAFLSFFQALVAFL